MVTVHHSLTTAEQTLLHRLFHNGNSSQISLQMVALWRSLASHGLPEFSLKINSRNDHFLASISSETLILLDFIFKHNSKIPISPDLIFPFTASLSTLPHASLINILSKKDDLSACVRKLCNELHSEAKAILKDAINEGRRSEKVLTELNPNAREWDPIEDSAPEEDRCLFLTFSNGYPLSENQIVKFFTRKFGACVERVYVHYREGKEEPPLFGKVIFTVSSIPAVLLGGKQDAKFHVESKTMWCKRYDSRKTRTRAKAVVVSTHRRR